MTLVQPRPQSSCPDPLERAPRFADAGNAPRDWLRLGPPSLQGALVALVGRNTANLPLSSAQRLSHFPASHMVTLTWTRDMDLGLVRQRDGRSTWEPFGTPVVIAGSQAHPQVSWAPTTGRGYVACFTADAAHSLFGLDPAAIQDRFVPVDAVLGKEWAPLWHDLLASDDADLPSVLDACLGKRWQGLQGRNSEKPSFRQLGRHWVDRLAWHAYEWQRTHSKRHVERRVKSFSGRSLREWQSLVRTEGLFFAARDRYESGQALDWAALAQDEGFSDQAHMSRATKRITGFSPTEFTDRFIEDESFWMYRLWV